MGCAGSSICFPFWSYGGLELAHVALCFTHVSFLSLVLLVMQTVLLQAVARACVRAMRVPLVSLPANGQTILLAAVQDYCVACNLQRSASRMAYHMHMYECLHKRSMRVLQTHTHTIEDRWCCSAWGGATFSTTRASHFCKKKGSLHKQTRKQETRLICCCRKV